VRKHLKRKMKKIPFTKKAAYDFIKESQKELRNALLEKNDESELLIKFIPRLQRT